MSLDDLLEGFALFDSWEERYRYIIELGRKLPGLEDDLKTELHRVQGCVSQVWMVSERPQDAPETLVFHADSDSHIVRGLIAILLLAYSHKPAAVILGVNIEGVFDQLGLGQHLSPNRRNGFFSMVERIQRTAAAAV